MIPKEDARHIIHHLDPARLARPVWRDAARSLAMEAGFDKIERLAREHKRRTMQAYIDY